MREIRPYGSVGGAAQLNAPSLPLSWVVSKVGPAIPAGADGGGR